MNFRELLKAQGLTDEQISAITGAMTKEKIYTTTEEKIEDRYNKLKNQNAELNKMLTERDKQLEKLSQNSSNNAELTKQLEELKALNENTKTEYESKISKMEFDNSLDNALSGAKCKNTKALKALLNMENIVLKDGKLDGLNEQLEAIKANESYLFEDTVPANTGSVGSFGGTASTGFDFGFNNIR